MTEWQWIKQLRGILPENGLKKGHHYVLIENNNIEMTTMDKNQSLLHMLFVHFQLPPFFTLCIFYLTHN